MNKLPIYDPKVSVPFNFGITTNKPETVRSAERLFRLLNISTGNKDNVKLKFLVTLLLNMNLSLYNEHMLAISLRPEHYAKSHKRYRPVIKSYDTVRTVLRALEQFGYIELIKGIKLPGHDTGVQTKIAPAEKLVGLLTDTQLSEASFTPPQEVIILRERNESKKEIDYEDTFEIRNWRRDLNTYNELRSNSVITLYGLSAEQFENEKNFFFKYTMISADEIWRTEYQNLKSINLKTTYVKRIFSEDFNKGGRIYGGSEQQLPSEYRNLIKINGEPTVELDYSSYHLRMLYHLRKRNLSGNAYQSLSGDDPDMYKIYKSLALRCINCKSEKAVLQSFRKYLVDEKLQGLFPDLKDITLKVYINKLSEKHSKIKHDFLTDKGVVLQNIDSKISNNIIKHFFQKPDPVLVLPIHDSFIVPAGYKDELYEVMKQEYFKVFKKYPEIKIS
ncbi:MAG TPA: hypothetical protein PKA90_16970 [Ignavibacteria bacterium]|nr:hypothetical protein [Ignavibacteria bacterium]HMR42111.1 hypothetical protein [Ignavibacteria bacterium]